MTRRGYSFMLYYEQPNAVSVLCLLWPGGDRDRARDLQYSHLSDALILLCVGHPTTYVTTKLILEKHSKEWDDKCINT